MKKIIFLLVMMCSILVLTACPTPGVHEHELSEWVSDETNHWHTCSGCEELLDTEAHAFGEWETTKAATCTAKGSEERSCTTCGYKEVKEVEAKGHTPGAEATCEAAQTCTVCGAVLAGKAEHTPGAEATCEAAQTCTVCGEELAAKLPHTFSDEWSMDETYHWHAASCTHEEEKSGYAEHDYTATDEGKVRTYACECGYSYEVELFELSVEYKYASGLVINTVNELLEKNAPYAILVPEIDFMVADKEAETGLMTEDKEVVVTYDYSAELVNVTEVGQKFGPTMVDPEKGLSISYIINGATNDWEETIVGETFTLFAGCLRARDSKIPAVYSADWYEGTGIIEPGYAWNSLLNGEYLVTWSISTEGIKCYRNGLLAFTWNANLTPGGQWTQAGGPNSDSGKTIADLVANIFTEIAAAGFEMGTLNKSNETLHSASFDQLLVGYAVDAEEAADIAEEFYNIRTITVKYLTVDGRDLLAPTTFEAAVSGEYSFAAPQIAGFVAQEEVIAGVLEKGQKVINVVYEIPGEAKLAEPIVENKFELADGWQVDQPILHDKGITIATGLTGDFTVVMDAHFDAIGGWVGNTLLPVIQDSATGDFALTRFDWYGHLFDVDGNGCTVGTQGDWGKMFVTNFDYDYFNLIDNCDILTSIVRSGDRITVRTVFTPGEGSVLPYTVYVLEQVITGCTAESLDIYATANYAKMSVKNVYAPVVTQPAA